MSSKIRGWGIQDSGGILGLVVLVPVRMYKTRGLGALADLRGVPPDNIGVVFTALCIYYRSTITNINLLHKIDATCSFIKE